MWGERGVSGRIGIGPIAAFVGVVVLSVLGACTEDPAPVGPGPTGATASSSAPVTPKPQAPAQEPTPESAVNFARYFWDTYNYAYATNDVGPVRAISDPACKFCASVVSDVEKTVTAKAKNTGFDVSVIETISPPVEITTGTLVIMTVSQKPGTLTMQNGETTEDAGWKRLRIDFSLKWNGDGWAVEGVDADTKNGTRWDA